MAASMVFDRSRAALEVTVVRRPLTDYDRLAGLPKPPGPQRGRWRVRPADTVKCRIYVNQASQVCVDFSRATIAVNDGRVDGLTAVGYWSGPGTTGSCVDGGGGGNDDGVVCSLPARYGATVCFRAAVRKGSDIRGQTDRTCGTITFRKSGPS